MIAVDINPRMVGFAKLNRKRRGISNVKFFVVDCLNKDFVDRIKERVEYVFCDPSSPSK